MTWKTITLGDILTESKILSNDPDTDRRITVRLNCGGVEKRSLRNDKSGATKYYIRKKGQFIYGQQNLHNGAFGIIPEELDGYESSGDLPTFDIDSSCKPERLVYFLKQGGFYRGLSRIAKGIGSRRIYPEQLFKIEIPLPSIEEQEKIIKTIKQGLDTGSKLDIITYDNGDLVKRLRQSILQDAIQGQLVPQDSNDEPAGNLLKKIETEKEQLIREKKNKKGKDPIIDDEKPFDLPKGWERTRLGDIIENSDNLNIQSKLSSDTIINYIDIDAIDNVRYKIKRPKINKVSELSSRARRVLKKGYILYSTVRPYLNNIAIIEDDLENFIGSTGFVVFKPIIINTKFVFYFLLTEYVRIYYMNFLKGFNSPSITDGQFSGIPIPIPPLEQQNRIVNKVDELMRFCDDLEKQISEAKENGERLMESLLGEVFK